MQQELIEMLEEIIQYVEVWHPEDGEALNRAEALIKKAKKNTVQEGPDKHEREMLEVIDERDRIHECADQLADAIAKHTGYEIGEHTSANNPWRMALNALVCHEAKQEVTLTDEFLKEAAGSPEGYKFAAKGISKIDVWPHGGNWFPLYSPAQVQAIITALRAKGQ